MDKARRHELKMLKFKKRLQNYGFVANGTQHYAFRSTGKPCSCYMCSPGRFEKGVVKRERRDVMFEVEQSFGVGRG